MRIRNRHLSILAAMLLLIPTAAFGQSSSLNTFSPYSFYGLGDLSAQGTTNVRSMGGAGVAVRDYTAINYINPASYSAIRRQSALFSVGLEGQNFYLQDSDYKSSFNTFNIRDLALQLPLGHGIGMAVSVTPYSSVGYRITPYEMNTEIGPITNYYSGSGGLNQYKIGVGWELWENRLSIGAEMAYYHGSIERAYTLTIEPILAGDGYSNLNGIDTEKISTIMVNAGIQAILLLQPKRIFTFGATYRMGGKMKGRSNQYIPHIPGMSSSAASGLMDDVRNQTSPLNLYMPHIGIAGFYYATTNFSAAVDYTYSSWGASNKNYSGNDVKYRDTHAIGGGIEWTPNAMDPRSYFRRCSYRMGVRYSDYYMKFYRDGDWRSLNDMAVSLGIGFPLDHRRRNFIDVGIEGGMRGTTNYGLIQDKYFKVSVGFRLFGDDYWFQKYKYN